MSRLNLVEPQLQPVCSESTRHSEPARRSDRSWLPMQPHLLVELDPIRWSQRAQADQRWQAERRRLAKS